MDLHHANSRANLDSVNWDKGIQAKSHPFRVRVTPTHVYNHETGEVAAIAAPGYEFYYAHQHAHLAPVGFDTNTAIAEVEGIKTQVAQPLSGGMGSAMATVSTSMLPILLSALSKGESCKESTNVK